jgi:serine phosphatase RsbU (regulator of sigma subunit)
MHEELFLKDRNLEIIIKELRDTLGKMELALGSIHEAIVWTGADGGIQWCNAGFDRLINKMHLAIISNNLVDLLPLSHQGEPVKPHEHPVFKILKNSFKNTEYEFLYNDKQLILEISGSILELKTGEKAAVMTLRDITERKQMEQTLIQANQQISALNEQLKTENLRLGAELDVARQIQMMILPKPEELENLAGLDLAGYMEPADEVGGDYYDVLATDGIITLGIGDVTGHGLESGILMLMTQTAVRTLQEIRELNPVRFLDALNRAIYKNVQRMNSEKSLTLAIINYGDGKISISGQHEETIIVRKGGVIERIDTMNLGFPMGLDEEIMEFISHANFDLYPGDGIVLYTDGIPEAKDINKVQYQVERLCEVISENWHKSAADIKDAVITDLRRHIGTQKVFDDITLLVLKREEKAHQEVQNQLKTTVNV